ncbi:MAG TPA: hypothetical protein DCY58_02500 [Acetobacterium sp.]|nr:hypothetical protein [Acetobacterium sp.]
MIRMNNKIKNFFGVGDMFFSLMVVLEIAFLMVFLTDVLKLDIAVAGTIISITSLGDLITSFIAGGIVDKSNMKWGKYRSWLLVGPAIASIFFVLQFTQFGTATTTAIIFTVCYLISHTLWNIFYTANRALAGAVTDDPTERAHISGRIAAWMNAGRIIGSKLIIVMILFFATNVGGGNQLVGYTCTALVTSVLMCIGYFIHFKITEGYDLPQEVKKENSPQQKVTIIDMFKGVGQNPPLISVLFCDFFRLSGYYAMMAMVAYYSKIVLKDPAGVGNMLLVLNIGCLLGALLSKTFVTKFGTKGTSVVGLAGASAFMVVAMLVSPNVMTVMVCLGLSQICYGVSFGLTTSLYANSATYAEFTTKKNTTGFIMGLLSFSIKTSQFIRGLIITFVLGFIGYSAQMTVTEQTIGNMSMAFFAIPAILIAVGILPLLLLKMKDSDVIEMRKEIEARKNTNTTIETN